MSVTSPPTLSHSGEGVKFDICNNSKLGSSQFLAGLKHPSSAETKTYIPQGTLVEFYTFDTFFFPDIISIHLNNPCESRQISSRVESRDKPCRGSIQVILMAIRI